MGIFSRFENKAEDVIEGSGGRGRGGIEPVKLAKRACKEMEHEKMIGVGHEYAPTLYNILVSPEDDAAMSGYYPSLAGEIETYLTGQGAQRGLVFDCPPLARFIVDDGLRRGKFDIIAESVSPAIIAELRHEEMVRYGIEPDYDNLDDFDFDRSHEHPRRPAPRPEAELESDFPADDGFAGEPIGGDFDEHPFVAPSPVATPAPEEDVFGNAADEDVAAEQRTVMLNEPIAQQPRASRAIMPRSCTTIPAGSFATPARQTASLLMASPRRSRASTTAISSISVPPSSSSRRANLSMVDLLLLAGRLLLFALRYLFLFFVVKTGVGLVRGQNKKAKSWTLNVEKGPRTLKGVRLTIAGPIVIGRAPGADIVIPTDYVSARHARFSLTGTSLSVEDLNSTNGTLLNGHPVTEPVACSEGDIVTIGNVDIKIGRQ